MNRKFRVQRRHGKKGFTLVELIVVLVILGILAAIMVPSLLGWIDKAKEKQHLLEARSVVLSARTVVTEKYAEGKFSENDATFLNTHKEEILKLAGVSKNGKNDIREIKFKEVAVVRKLRYRAADGTVIVYDIDGNPVYKIEKDIGAPIYSEEWPSIIEDYLEKNGGYGSTTDLRNAILNAYDGSFPELTADEKKLLTTKSDKIKPLGNIDELTWKPVQAAGTKGDFIMIASSTDGNNINANVIYYNGNYYACLHNHPYQGYKFDAVSIKSDFDVSQLINAKTLDYYEENLNEIGPDVYVFAKLN